MMSRESVAPAARTLGAIIERGVAPQEPQGCRTGTGVGVAQVPEPRLELSRTCRSHCVKDVPGPHTQA